MSIASSQLQGASVMGQQASRGLRDAACWVLAPVAAADVTRPLSNTLHVTITVTSNNLVSVPQNVKRGGDTGTLAHTCNPYTGGTGGLGELNLVT